MEPHTMNPHEPAEDPKTAHMYRCPECGTGIDLLGRHTEHDYRCLKKDYMKAIDILKRCYQSGHREGWEDGESTEETMNSVRHYLDSTDPGWQQTSDFS